MKEVYTLEALEAAGGGGKKDEFDLPDPPPRQSVTTRPRGASRPSKLAQRNTVSSKFRGQLEKVRIGEEQGDDA